MQSYKITITERWLPTGHVPFEIRFYDFPHLPKIGNIFEDNVVLFFLSEIKFRQVRVERSWKISTVLSRKILQKKIRG